MKTLKKKGHLSGKVTCYETAWDACRACVWMALEYMEGGDIQSLLVQRASLHQGPLPADFLRSARLPSSKAIDTSGLRNGSESQVGHPNPGKMNENERKSMRIHRSAVNFKL